MKFIGIIPARFDSVRFPGKPLIDINGKTMIQRTYEQAIKSKHLIDVIVATDNYQIYEHVYEFGNVIMTKTIHKSGTERCLEGLELINKNNFYNNDDYVINIQGDEPFINPEQIDLLIENIIKNKKIEIITLIKKINSYGDFMNKNIVKVVFSKNKKALYFSRQPIPYQKNNLNLFGYKHIGIYGYNIKILKQINKLKESNLENNENLEQLKWLENDFNVSVVETDIDSFSIDTIDDLNHLLNNKKIAKNL